MQRNRIGSKGDKNHFGGFMTGNRSLWIKSVFILTLLGGLFQLSSGPIKEKFLEENDKKNRQVMTEEEKKSILESNLTMAFRGTLQRDFDYCGANEVTLSGENYERSEVDPRLIYITFESIVGYYYYGTAPDAWRVFPDLEKFHLEKGKTYKRNRDSDCQAKGSSSTQPAK